MAAKETWDIEPFVRVGPFALGTDLREVVAVLGEEPRRCFPRTVFGGRTCYFRNLGVSVDVEDGLEEVSFDTRGSIVPVYRGIRLLGNWKLARTRLAEIGIDTPEPDRNEEQTVFITDGLVAWSRFEHVGADTITVALRRPVPKHSYATPEEAALSGYTPGARARVISVRMIDEATAEVTVDTEPFRPIISRCRLWDDPRGWHERSNSGVW